MNRENAISYKFKSEKRRYTLRFNQTEISIGDIKKMIIRRRNMEKYPEKYELIFTDEKTEERLTDEVKIEPMRSLLIQRVPFHKLSQTFRLEICDSIDLPNPAQTFLEPKKPEPQKQNDPLEKILLKIDPEEIKNQFGCEFCKKIEGEPMITTCCGKTACEVCIKMKVVEGKLMCPFGCESELNFLNNLKVKDMRDKLYSMVNNTKLIDKLKNLKNPQLNTSVEPVPIRPMVPIMPNHLQNNPHMPLHPGNIPNQQQLYPNMPHHNVYQPPNVVKTTMSENVSSGLNQGEYVNQNYISPLNDTSISQSNPHFRLFDNARFFIIKSSNRDNVQTSQAHNEWATTVTNQKKLNDAFYQKDVILIFSINKSGFFQGYAMMTSFITDNESKLWNNDYSVKLGGTFSTQWLVCCELPFSSVKELNNQLNNGEPVIKSRDTQELPKEIGIQLCHKCYLEGGRKSSYDTERITKLMEENKKIRERMYYKNNSVQQPRPGPMNPALMNPQPKDQMNPYYPMMPPMYMYPQMPFPYDYYRMPYPGGLKMPQYFYEKEEDKKARERSREKSKSNKSKSRSKSK